VPGDMLATVTCIRPQLTALFTIIAVHTSHALCSHLTADFPITSVSCAALAQRHHKMSSAAQQRAEVMREVDVLLTIAFCYSYALPLSMQVKCGGGKRWMLLHVCKVRSHAPCM
jgi:hypothetical protein